MTDIVYVTVETLTEAFTKILGSQEKAQSLLHAIEDSRSPKHPREIPGQVGTFVGVMDAVEGWCAGAGVTGETLARLRAAMHSYQYGEPIVVLDKRPDASAGPPVAPNAAVHHPTHYTFGTIEVIDVIDDWRLGFCLGNTVKYIARADHKGRRLEDLQKAAWYLAREIEKESVR